MRKLMDQSRVRGCGGSVGRGLDPEFDTTVAGTARRGLVADEGTALAVSDRDQAVERNPAGSECRPHGVRAGLAEKTVALGVTRTVGVAFHAHDTGTGPDTGGQSIEQRTRRFPDRGAARGELDSLVAEQARECAFASAVGAGGRAWAEAASKKSPSTEMAQTFGPSQVGHVAPRAARSAAPPAPDAGGWPERNARCPETSSSVHP